MRGSRNVPPSNFARKTTPALSNLPRIPGFNRRLAPLLNTSKRKSWAWFIKNAGRKSLPWPKTRAGTIPAIRQISIGWALPACNFRNLWRQFRPFALRRSSAWIHPCCTKGWAWPTTT